MKLGVFTVSMPDYEPVEALRTLAAMGYDGVEWRVTTDTGDRATPSFWSGNRTTMTADELIARADELKAVAAETGMAMPSLGAYIHCANLEAVELHCKATAAIGARNVRIGSGGYDKARGDYPAQLAEARAKYKEVAEIAKRYNVRAVIETHMGLLTPTVPTTMDVLHGLDPQYVGIMWDPGNQVVEGREVYSMAIEAAGEYLAEVHAKNMVYVQVGAENGRATWKTMQSPLREGIVDWYQVIADLKKAHYDGWIFFEDFSVVYPLEERLRGNLAWFRELIG